MEHMSPVSDSNQALYQSLEDEASQSAKNIVQPSLLDRCCSSSCFNKLGSKISCRFVLISVSFLGFIVVYVLRVNLSVAIVAMVNKTFVARISATYDDDDGVGGEVGKGGDVLGDLCFAVVAAGNVTVVEEGNGEGNTVTLLDEIGEFDWNKQTQGFVLGSFFVGYIMTQILGGRLAERFGAKLILGLGVFVTALLTLLTPLVARRGVYYLMFLRFLEGIFEGVCFPSMHSMLAKWAPPHERSQMGGFIYAGAQIGTVVGMIGSGFLIKNGFAGGWPSVFYVSGLLGCSWCVLWIFFCFDSPAKHPRISAKEREYIESSLNEDLDLLRTPWKAILTSVPVWAIATAHFSYNWAYYTLLTALPIYLSDVLHVDIKQNSLSSGLPYLACWLSMVVSGKVADYLINRQILSVELTRKFFTSTGMLVSGLLLIATTYVGCNRSGVVSLITVTLAVMGMCSAGYHVNHLDLAPQFAGTLMGFTNTFGTIPGFVGPYIFGGITSHHSTQKEWRIVFLISFGIQLLGSLVFSAFSSGKQQAWSTREVIA